MTADAPLLTRMIIVDDEVDHAGIVQQLLREMAPELEVEVLCESAGLLERLLGAPDQALVLLDRLLDGREVFPTLCMLREQRSDLTIAVLSAALSMEDRNRALAAGADRAEQKPGRLTEWRAMLAELLLVSERRRLLVPR